MNITENAIQQVFHSFEDTSTGWRVPNTATLHIQQPLDRIHPRITLAMTVEVSGHGTFSQALDYDVINTERMLPDMLIQGANVLAHEAFHAPFNAYAVDYHKRELERMRRNTWHYKLGHMLKKFWEL